MKRNRTSYSIKNSLTSLLSSSIAMLIGFVAQSCFIKILGIEYLGLNGLFSNILTFLSLFELGIGNAIVFNLYKPLALNDLEKIKTLMNFYKRSYNLIATIVLIFGILFMPFLKFIIGNVTVDINIYLVYFLFLISTVSSYVLAYKRSLLYANQENYIINIIHMIYLVALNLLQLTVIFYTKNYYYYLIVKIICVIFENLVLSKIANNKYSYINDRDILKLTSEEKNNIFIKVKALFFHKIGSVIVQGTDNILISTFFSVIVVGIYSNYQMILNAVSTIFSQFFSSISLSVGNLMAIDRKKSFETFSKLRFLNFTLALFSSILILNIIQSFIIIWVGNDYLLDKYTVIILVFNYFQSTMRNSYAIFKDSTGTWVEDKYVPIIESLLNIIFSILLISVFGLPGVFLGTFVSSLVLWCYSYPRFVYKKLFNRSFKNYFIETIGYIFVFIFVAFLTYYLSSLINLENIFLSIIMKAIISILFTAILFLIIFVKNKNFKFFYNLFKKVLFRRDIQ